MPKTSAADGAEENDDLVSQKDIDQLQSFVDLCTKSSKRIPFLVLTGAGISTESGIPDYRSPVVGLYERGGYKPMTYAAFLGSESARRRYWARSYLNWPRFSSATPNTGHLVLRKWQTAGVVGSIVTQNVDRLHHKAGSEAVVELHGSLYSVRCLRCRRRTPRTLMQKMMTEVNAGLLAESQDLLQLNNEHAARPDGDTDILSSSKKGEAFVERFQIPDCDSCGSSGILKPDIVFFGDNVARSVVEEISGLVERASGLLVLGSSLQVFSSYRFVAQAARLQKPILIVNIGPTRADGSLPQFVLRLNAKIGHLLPRIKVE